MRAVVGALRVNLGLDSAEFSKGLKNANSRADRFGKKLAAGIGAGVAAAVVGLSALAKRSLSLVDNQAKLALSLGTSVKSIQTLQLAGDLAGVSMGTIEQATIALTRRLSMFATDGGGPAANAIERLGLSVQELNALPLDERLAVIQERIQAIVPAAEQAAVASQLFGDRAGVVFSRIDPETLRGAARDVEDFGVAMSEVDAAKIQEANDAVARLGLVATGLGNRLAAAVAPIIERIATGLADMFRAGAPLGNLIVLLTDNLADFALGTATVAALIAGKWVAGMAAGVSITGVLTKALAVLRFAILRLPFVAIVAAITATVVQFGKLVRASGGVGVALELLWGVAEEVFGRMRQGVALTSEVFFGAAQFIKGGWLKMFASLATAYARFTQLVADGLNSLTGSSLKGVGAEFAADLTKQAAQLILGGRAVVKSAIGDAAALGGPLKSVEKLRDVMKSAGDETREADSAATDLNNTLAGLDTGGGEGGGGGKAAAGVKKVKSEVEGLSDAASSASDGFKDFFKSIANGSASAGEALSALAGKLLDDVLDQALTPVSNLFGQIFSNLGSSISSSLFGGSTPKIPQYASGTNNHPGGLAIVGEEGPELVNMRRGAQVIPNGQFGGGMMVSQSFVIHAGIGSNPEGIVDALRPVMRNEASAMIGRARREGR